MIGSEATMADEHQRRQHHGVGKSERVICLLLLVLVSISAHAAGLEIRRVGDGIYAIVGELGNRSPQNLGNNATFGLVVTADGAVLIDPGGSYQGAQAIDEIIRGVTAQPVVKVINTGGQDHRWLGNGYFRERGAEIIASERAVADQRARARDQLIGLTALVGADGVAGTEPVYAEQRFAETHSFSLGGIRFEIHHAGQAHTPGDAFVWLPQQQVMFSGDIVYVERMLGVGAQSNSRSWIAAFEAMAAYRPARLVPGHGGPATLELAHRDTLDYLRFLRAAVADFMDAGGDLSDISSIDQSAYRYLQNYDTLAARNAQKVFTEMEWE